MRNKILLGLTALLMCSCTKEITREIIKEPVIVPSQENCGLISVLKDGFTSANSSEIFADDEPDEIFFARKMKVNEPLQVSIDSNQNLSVSYYGPRSINDVTIWAKLNGYDKEFKLAHFEEIPSFIEFLTKLPMIDKSLEYVTADGKTIEIAKNPYISSSDISLRIECNDAFYNKVTTMNSDLELSIGTYHTQGGNWIKILPSHAREGIAIFMNIGYMFGTSEFADSIMKHRYYSNNNDESELSHDAVITKARRKGGKVILGTTSGVDGLGGGNTLGVAEWQYVEHYADDKSEHEALFHEYGHCMGYGHSGNMTYNSYGGDVGFVHVCRSLYEKMSKEKQLPVYSRRFLQTRKTRYTYGQSKYQASKYVIEDSSLDIIDGGLDEIMNKENICDHLKGDPLSFQLNFADVPNATVETFQPKDICTSGEYIYVLNDASQNQSVEMFKITDGKPKHFKSLKQWLVNGQVSNFAGSVNGIGVGRGFVYVNSQDSRTDIFDEVTLDYITSIGNGSWGNGVNQTVHSFETIVRDEYVFIQDKQKVNIYKLEDIVPEMRSKISRIAQTNVMGNYQDTFGFDIDCNGIAYVAHAPSKAIFVYDFSKFRQHDVIGQLKSLTLSTAVLDVACWNEKLVGVQKSKPYLVGIDKETGKIIKDYSSIYDFVKLEKISVSRGTLFCVDRGNKEIVALPISLF